MLADSRLTAGLPPLPGALLVTGVVLALALVVAGPIMPVAALLLGVVVAVLVFLRPEFAVVLLAFTIPFGSVREFSAGGFTVTASDGLVALLAASWVGAMVVRRELRFTWSPLAVPMLLFLGWAVFSVTVADRIGAPLPQVIKWVQFAIVFWFVASVVRTTGQRRIIVLALLAAGLAEAMLGAYQFLMRVGPDGFILFGRFIRSYGTFGQPNPFAGYVNTVALLGLGLLAGWVVRDRGMLRRPEGWFVLGVTAVAAVAVAMSFSRGAWIGLGVGACAIVVASDRRAIRVVLAAVLAAGLVGLLGAFDLLPAALAERLSSVTNYFGLFDARTVIVTPENYAVVERMATWQAAAGMWQSSPTTGIGLGAFNDAYPTFSLPGWDYTPGHAHNLVLNALAETGLVGLVLWIGFLGGQAVVIARAVRQGWDGNPWAWPVALGVMGAWLAILVHNMLDNLYVHYIQLQVAILLGLCAAWVAGQRERTRGAGQP